MFGIVHPALAIAAGLAIVTSLVHAALLQRIVVRPLARRMSGDAAVSATVRRLHAPLLHYTSFGWLIGGIALLAIAAGLEPGARPAISLLAGATFAYAAIANAWATRGRHPGWLLMAAATALIAFDISLHSGG